jgi:hypothetical protein
MPKVCNSLAHSILFSVLFLCCFLVQQTYAQSNINVKTNLLNFSAPITKSEYPWTQTQFVAFTPGLSISYEFFLIDRKWSNRISAGIITPNFSNPGFSLSNSLHLSLYSKWKTAINLAAGISFAFFQSETSNQQPIVYPLVALELNQSLNNKTDLSISLASNYPNTLSLSGGLRYWISKKITKRPGCLACPD